MNIDDYLEANIGSRSRDSCSQSALWGYRMNGASEEELLYNRDSKDLFLHSANAAIFGAMLNCARKFSDVFEAYCSTGLLGCYIAGGISGRYAGVDSSKMAIALANERRQRLSGLLSLERATFTCVPLWKYTMEHDAVLGRFILGKIDATPREEKLITLLRISTNLILCESAGFETSIDDYLKLFSRFNLSASVVACENVALLGNTGYVVYRVCKK